VLRLGKRKRSKARFVEAQLNLVREWIVLLISLD
jgi:hypothetical protein